MKKSLTVLAALATIALSLTACSQGVSPTSSAGGLTPLKISVIGIASDAAIRLGVSKGFFSDEKLALSFTTVANPSAGLAAAQGGQVDLAYAPSIPVINALSQSLPLSIVAAADGYRDGAAKTADPSKVDDTGLYVNGSSGISTVAELVGKTIAVPARKAQMEVTVSKILKDSGVNPNKVTWVALDFASALAALKSKKVDAAALTNPFTTQAKEGGMKLLASPGIAFFQQGAVGLWVAGKSTVASKRTAITAFQRAIYKSNAYADDHTEEATALGLRLSGMKIAASEATTSYWPVTVRAADIKRTVSEMLSLGFLTKTVAVDGAILTQP